MIGAADCHGDHADELSYRAAGQRPGDAGDDRKPVVGAGAGLLIAYMILGVQFNSFIHPLTVLLAMPFAVTGAMVTLWLTGDTLNMMSMIGLILLMGLVKKNSIILVDYINQLRGEGKGLTEAILWPVRCGCGRS